MLSAWGVIIDIELPVICEFLEIVRNYLFLGTTDLDDIEGLTPMGNEVIQMFHKIDDGRKKCVWDTWRYFTENYGEVEDSR